MADLQVAQTIMQQLGGNKFRAMVGARGFVGSPDGVSFYHMGGRKRVTMCRVTLTPDDDYTVDFMKMWQGRPKVVTTREHVYFDQLPTVFEEVTGLRTSL